MSKEYLTRDDLVAASKLKGGLYEYEEQKHIVRPVPKNRKLTSKKSFLFYMVISNNFINQAYVCLYSFYKYNECPFRVFLLNENETNRLKCENKLREISNQISVELLEADYSDVQQYIDEPCFFVKFNLTCNCSRLNVITKYQSQYDLLINSDADIIYNGNLQEYLNLLNNLDFKFAGVIEYGDAYARYLAGNDFGDGKISPVSLNFGLCATSHTSGRLDLDFKRFMMMYRNIYLIDQDYMNVRYDKYKVSLDPKWNSSKPSGHLHDAYVYHFLVNNIKPYNCTAPFEHFKTWSLPDFCCTYAFCRYINIVKEIKSKLSKEFIQRIDHAEDIARMDHEFYMKTKLGIKD